MKESSEWSTATTASIDAYVTYAQSFNPIFDSGICATI
jgi:hypothetical protein